MSIPMGDFLNHPSVTAATRKLAEGPPSPALLPLWRFLISVMLINSWARAGAVAGMTIGLAKSAQLVVQGEDRTYVVSVADHKTGYQGPFQIPLTELEYKALGNVCENALRQNPQATLSFITGSGNPFPVSGVCQEHAKTWQETEMTDKYCKFTSKDNRKRFASLLF